MFENIGGKIKANAKICCWILIVMFIFWGIFLLCLNVIMEGIIVLIAGPVAAWTGSFALYGFGELVENSCIQTNLMIKQDMEKKKGA